MSVRQWLREARAGSMGPEELFTRLAAYLPTLLIPLLPGSRPGTLVRMATELDSGEILAVFCSDDDAGRQIAGTASAALAEKDTLLALTEVMRVPDFDGAVFNPQTPSELVVDREYLRDLFREVAVRRLSKTGDVWVPETENGIIVVRIDNGTMGVPVYLSEQDAASALPDRAQAHVSRYTWGAIWDCCWSAGADGAWLQFGYPESTMLGRHHLSILCGDGRASPLDRLDAVLESATIGISSEKDLCRAMAETDRIWILYHGELQTVSFGRVVPVFTTGGEAARFAALARRLRPEIPPLEPRLANTQKLLARLLPQKATIAVHPGSKHGWMASPESMALILSLMESEEEQGEEGT